MKVIWAQFSLISISRHNNKKLQKFEAIFYGSYKATISVNFSLWRVKTALHNKGLWELAMKLK